MHSRARHRIPVLFSLSMMDVLCCALGCVILLWLVNSREAKQRNAEASDTKGQLDETTAKLDSAKLALDQTRDARDAAQRERDAAQRQLETTATDLRALRHTSQQLRADLAILLEKNKDLLAKIKLKEDDFAKLEQHDSALAEARAKLAQLLKDRDLDLKKAEERWLSSKDLAKLLQEKLDAKDKLVQELTTRIDGKDSKIKEITGKVSAADIQIAKLLLQSKDAQKLIEQLNRLLDESKKDNEAYKQKLTKSDGDASTLSKDIAKKDQELKSAKANLDELLQKLTNLAKLNDVLEQKLKLSKLDLSQAKADLSSVQKEKLELLQKALHMKEELANRFAGIELTGKKVIFLVDTSGSMGMLDTKTPDDKKWPTVCSIIGKLMRSLPDVTHYQVIAFSDKVTYPLGDDYKRKWLVYDPKHSADFVVSKLQKLKPQGATSMYPAFDEAFLYKIGGLDTIYLISDGLPDPPEDEIPAAIKKLTPAQQSAHFCNQVRQQLKTTWNAPANGRPPVRINAVGFFFDSPEVGAFLWALTRENDGNFVGMSKP